MGVPLTHRKWGLFETNYQRVKGITTEESLQEIEHAAKHGVTSSSQNSQFNLAKSTQGGSSGAASLLAPSSGATSSGGAPRSVPMALGGAAASLPGASGGGGGGGGARGFGTAEPRSDFKARSKQAGPPSAGAGAAMFAQFQTKNAAKFKPGHKG